MYKGNSFDAFFGQFAPQPFGGFVAALSSGMAQAQAEQQHAFAVRVANQAAKEARQDWHQRSPFPPETKKVKHVESKVIESNPLPQSHHLLYGGECEE